MSLKNTIVPWLKEEACISPIDERDILYSIDKIKTKFKVQQLQVNVRGWIVLNIKESWVEFAVFNFAESEINGENIYVEFGELIFHGEGISGCLRECRHTYWGENGYIFYLPGDLITAAFQVLSEYFDGMISKQ
jgi:hypothetical protein